MKIVVIDERLYDYVIHHKEINYKYLTLESKYGVKSCYSIFSDHDFVYEWNKFYPDLELDFCEITDEEKFSLLLLEYSDYILKIIENESKI